MRLSIFSFRTLVGKSVIAVTAMTLVYILFIAIAKPSMQFSQNQYQANIIFAQDFLYEKNKPSGIIVGSSMSTRMKFDKCDDVYNLAFGGGGPLTGLEIIRKSGYIPKSIYIEVNKFSMPPDNEMLGRLFVPFLFELRGKVTAFQEKYQLLNLIGEVLFRVAGRSEMEKSMQKVDTRLLDKLVNATLSHQKAFRVENATVELWRKDIVYFQSKDTKIFFFEMPNDSRLVRMDSRKVLRKLVREALPNIPYMQENNDDDIYKTSDGIHLTWQSAIEFTNHFREHFFNK